jgi:hypothetical protein
MKTKIITNVSADYSDHITQVGAGDHIWERLINANTVRKDEFELILEEIKQIQELDLIATQDLIDMGLTIPASISDTQISVQDEEDADDAITSMNPVQPSVDETRTNISSVPMPVIMKSYRTAWRQEAFAWKSMQGLRRATRKVMEKSDGLVANGDSNITVTFNGTQTTLQGYTTLTNRATTTITTAWSTATTSILADVKAMTGAMIGTNKISSRPGSQMLYIPTLYENPINDTAFSNKGDRSFREQILHQYPQIKDIRTLTSLAADNVVLVAMDSQYVELAVAQQPIMVPHVKEVSIMPQDATVYAVWVPVLKTDANSLTGVVHATTA